MNAQFGLNGDNPGMPEDQKIENFGMVERVAKAIRNKSQETDTLDASICIQYARAAIEAMREPTQEMKYAGYTLCVGQDNMDKIYQAMIDAALKD